MTVNIDLVPNSKIVYLRRKLLSWGRRNYSDFPWRYETNPFHALTAEILLQRTKAEQVVPVYMKFKQRFPDALALASASIVDIESVIEPLGLKWRAKFLSALGRSIVEMDGELPTDEKSLRSIPGVGPYAAAAYLSLHTGRRASIVDSNVVRLYGRFFGFDTGPETRRDKSILVLADRVTPVRAFKDYNYGVLDFTRLICKPKPLCIICPVGGKCAYILRNIAGGGKGIERLGGPPIPLIEEISVFSSQL